MSESVLSERRINTGRQLEVDLLKSICILFLVVTHCYDELLISNDYAFFNLVGGLATPTVGAQAFMMCMGIGVAYTRANPKGPTTTRDFARRGVSLLIVGQVLNLARFAIPFGTLYLITGDLVARSWVFMVFCCDIMQFAGLCFLSLALFTKLRLDPSHMFAASLALSFVGTLLEGRIATGSYVLDQFLGMFVHTDAESYFPLFHWMVFPMFGMLFGDLLQHVRDKRRFYRVLFPSLLVVTVAYYYMAIFVDQGVFLVVQDELGLNRVGVFEALAQCACCTFFLSLLYFASTHLNEAVIRAVNFTSSNINRFYCVQWVLVFTTKVIVVLNVKGRTAPGGIALLCFVIVAIIAATFFIVWAYQKWLAKPVGAIVCRHQPLCYAVVIVLSVAACVWAGQGIGWDYASFPSHSNDYHDQWPRIA